MAPRARKLALTAHVLSSVGWLGAVAGTLALAIAGLTSDSLQTVRAAYLAMELMAWVVLVPLAVASLLTGILTSLGTKWGLFRHWWVVFKLVINVVATAVLLMYTDTLASLADRAEAASAAGDLEALRTGSPVLHAGVAVALLVAATVLGVFKPSGLTRYGWRKQREQRLAAGS